MTVPPSVTLPVTCRASYPVTTPREYPAISISSVPVAPSTRLPVTVVKPGLAPIFSRPLLVSVPVPRLILPPLRIVPVLVSDALLTRLNVAPAPMLMVPALLAKPELVDIVPAVTRTVPLLTNTPGLMVKVPAVLPCKVPLLMMVEVLLWVTPPEPDMVMPAPICSVSAPK